MSMLKQQLKEGNTVLGTMLSEMTCHNLPLILRTAGFSFIIIDCEHGYYDFGHIASLVSVGNGCGITVLVRVPVIEREFITKVLDMGADGLLVPMVNTKELAEKVVEFAKYSPLGRRGLSTMRAHTRYNPPPLGQYMEIANARTIVLAQIETAKAVTEASDIAAVDGIDALIVGPNDLAADLGTPGQFGTPEMEAAISHVVSCATQAGKPSGIIDSKIPFLHKWQDRGMRVFSCSSEVGMLMKAAKSTVAEFSTR